MQSGDAAPDTGPGGIHAGILSGGSGHNGSGLRAMGPQGRARCPSCGAEAANHDGMLGHGWKRCVLCSAVQEGMGVMG